MRFWIGGLVLCWVLAGSTAHSDEMRIIREIVDAEGLNGPHADSLTSLPPPALTIAQLRASPPIGRIVRIVGYVVESYLCPPCPKGAQCKPCAIASAIFVADAPNHAPFALDAPPNDVVAITDQDPNRFERGIQYRFELAVTGRQHDRFDGRLLRSQRPDREPVWPDSPAVTTERAP
jgi:hypothetical protein